MSAHDPSEGNAFSEKAALSTFAPQPARRHFNWRNELDPEHWHVLASSLFARLLDGYETFILFVVIAPALRDLLAPDQLPRLSQYAGFILAAIVFGRAVGGMIGGILADYVGRKRTLVLSFILYAVAALLSGLSPGWVSLAIFRLLTGMPLGTGLALGATLIAESWPAAARARGQSVMQTAFGFGGMCAAGLWLVLEPLGYPSIWRWTLIVGVLPTLGLMFYTHRYVPESQLWLQKQRLRKRPEPVSRGDAGAPAKQPANQFTLAALFSEPLLRRQMVLCTMMSIGTVVGYWAVASWIPAYVESISPGGAAEGARWAGYAGLAFGFGAIPGYLAAGLLADRIGRRGMLACFFAGSLLSTQALYAWFRAPFPIVLAAALHGFFTQGQFAWLAIYPPELFPTAVRTTALGAIFNSARFLSVLGPISAGLLIAQLGGYSATAQVFSSVYLLALCAVPFLPETRGKPLPS
jgi:MFS family permease